MPTLIVVDAKGTEHALTARSGLTVMEIIRDSGLASMGECGGALSCASCHVIVDPSWADRLAAPEEFEVEMLEAVEDPAETSRLCCQITMDDALDSLRVTVPS